MSDDSTKNGSAILAAPVNIRPKPKPSTKTTGKAVTVKKTSVVPEKVKNQTPLSPAAKAHAAKQHAGTHPASMLATSTDSRGRAISVKDDSEDDVLKVANEMLSDDEDDEVAVVPRPARRAAASKPKKWILDDEDDDDDDDDDDEDGEEDVSKFLEDESD